MAEKLDDVFFGIDGATPLQTVHCIQSVTWTDITNGNNLMSKVNVEETLGKEITPESYQKLKAAYRIAN
jgi:hypothetical protein